MKGANVERNSNKISRPVFFLFAHLMVTISSKKIIEATKNDQLRSVESVAKV